MKPLPPIAAATLLGLLGSFSTSTAWAVLSKEASLQRCQETTMKLAQKYELTATKALDGCLKEANKQLLVKGKSVPDAKLAQKCATQMQSIDDSRKLGKSAAEKMIAQIKTMCDPATNPKLTHKLDDVTGKGAPTVDRPLNTKKIEFFCAQYTLKQTIDNVDDWIQCQRSAGEAAASSKLAAKFPDAPDVMKKLKDAIINLPPDPKNAALKSDAAANMEKLRATVDVDDNGDADLYCSQVNYTFAP